MNERQLSEALGVLGWSKAALARRLGVHEKTAQGWGVRVPKYAESYLELALLLHANGRAVAPAKRRRAVRR